MNLEKIARDIADALGDNFDYAFNSKPEWTAARGETKAGFRDVNQPFKPDYLDAAQAALTAIMDAGDGVQECAGWTLINDGSDGGRPSCGVELNVPVIEKLPNRTPLYPAHALTLAAAAERARIVAGLRANAKLCDCHALKTDECACGAWHDYKTKPVTEIADAIEAGEV
ncbi:MAG: hypothetical protein ACOY7T_08215 [Pseudomonadota bacterium]